MSDKRTDARKSAGLPKRWRFRDGAYYYRVPPAAKSHWDNKTEVKLGKTLHEAHLCFAQKNIQAPGSVRTVSELCDKYELQVVPHKSPATQKSDRYSLRFIRDTLGHFLISDVQGPDIRAAMIAIASEFSAKQAHLVRGVISHMYTRALGWGLYKGIHPVAAKQCPKLSVKECLELGIEAEVPRDRYVSDKELRDIYSIANPVLRAYLPLRIALGQRVGDILTIKLSDITQDEICIAQNKTAHSSSAQLRFPFKNPDGSENGLRELVAQAFIMCRAKGPKSKPFKKPPDHLFCTRDGKPYFDYESRTHSGWDSMWQRMMQKARKEGLVSSDRSKRFTDHDLRAKAASDSLDLEAARALMGHTNSDITKKVYRRKGELVLPHISALFGEVN